MLLFIVDCITKYFNNIVSNYSANYKALQLDT